MHAASRALAAGADFALLGPRADDAAASRGRSSPSGATRTGAGKSQTTRYLAGAARRRGLKPVVIRHPMPYGDLVAQRVQRFATYADLDRHDTTIEEREEYEPHLDAGRVVYAGVDYEAILRQAEAEADVILWDGGNNDFPFYRPDLYIVVADPLRPGDERHYHPGETNVRMADVVVINKVDSADAGGDRRASGRRSRELNPRAADRHRALRPDPRRAAPIAGKRVVVVEDGPTLTHGGMTYGAGVVAARRFGAASSSIRGPSPSAPSATSSTEYPALEPLVPAMGYGAARCATWRRRSTPATPTSSCRRRRST